MFSNFQKLRQQWVQQEGRKGGQVGTLKSWHSDNDGYKKVELLQGRTFQLNQVIYKTKRSFVN